MFLILWYIHAGKLCLHVLDTCYCMYMYMHSLCTCMFDSWACSHTHTHTHTHTLAVWLDSLREALCSGEGDSNQRRLWGTGIGDWGIRSGPTSWECVSHIPFSSHNQIWRTPQVSESNSDNILFLLYFTLWKTQMQHLYNFWFSAKVTLWE